MEDEGSPPPERPEAEEDQRITKFLSRRREENKLYRNTTFRRLVEDILIEAEKKSVQQESSPTSTSSPPSPSPPTPSPPTPAPPTPPSAIKPTPTSTPLPVVETEADHVSIVSLSYLEEVKSVPTQSIITPIPSMTKMPLDQPPSRRPTPSPVWGDPEEEIESESSEIHDVSPWRRILVSFTQDTTLHGIRFTTASSQFTSRRWLWTVLLMIAFSVFIYYVQNRLNEFFQYKKTVNVQVDYVSEVDFPSVTICNENIFRLTPAANGRWYNQVEKFLQISEPPIEESCGPDEFTCSDSTCITSFSVCDAFPDCLGGDDEENCNKEVVAVEESRLLIGQNATDDSITLETMYDIGGHLLTDLIIGCAWRGKPCNSTDTFSKTFTDLGVCYRLAIPDARIKQSGPGHGLSLTVNIEQYDYTKNPETGVGIKVLLNDYWDVPLMGDRAFAISPGLYSLVAIDKTRVENLEPPWGVCGESKLQYYSNYSISACTLDCENRYVRSQCGCRDLHMPPAPDNMHVCQVHEYMSCALPKIEEMRSFTNYCKCATPCSEVNLVPSLSFSSIAVDTDSGGAAQQQRVDRLTAKLTEAREIRYRLARDKYRQTMRTFFDIQQGYADIISYLKWRNGTFLDESEWLREVKNLMVEDCVSFTAKQTDIINTIKRTSLEAVRVYKDFLLNYLVVPSLILQRAFVEADTALGNVSSPEDHEEYNKTITSKIDSVLIYIDIALTEGLEQLRQSINSTSFLFSEYTYNKALMTPLLKVSRVNCSWCIDGEAETPLMELMGKKLLESINSTVLPALEEIREQAINLKYGYDNTTYRFNFTVECEKRTDEITTTEFITTTDTILTTPEAPVCLNEQVVSDWGQMVNITLDLVANISTMVTTIDTTLDGVVTDGIAMVEELLRYISPKCDSELVKLFDEYNDIYVKLIDALVDAKDEYEHFKDSFSSYEKQYVNLTLTLSKITPLARFVFQKNFVGSQTITLNNLLASRTNALNRIRRQINIINYIIMSQVPVDHLLAISRVWKYFNVTDASHVQASDSGCDDSGCEVEPQLVSTEWDYKTVSWKAELINRQNSFTDVLTQTENYLNNFVSGNVIDDAFYKKNFLQLDLFFRELTKKSVSQQKAYEYPALLSELGGLLGLMLGASVLTVIELIDMFIYNGIIKCIVNHREQRDKNNALKHQTKPPEVIDINGTNSNKKNHVVPL